MSKQKLLLVGAGGHARACIDVIEQQGIYSIHGLVGTISEVGADVLGYPILGTDDELPEMLADCHQALVTVGQIKSPAVRMKLFSRLVELGFLLPVITSPHAYVSQHAAIGSGTIILHGVVINAGAKVGSNCIVNSHSLLEHGVSIADHCHISTGAVVNGDASVGEGSFLGSGSVLRDGISLGKHCFVGMGLSVLRDQADNTQMVNPH